VLEFKKYLVTADWVSVGLDTSVRWYDEI